MQDNTQVIDRECFKGSPQINRCLIEPTGFAGDNMKTSYDLYWEECIMLEPSTIGEKEQELVTVIIPVHQAEEFIERCIQSVLNQTYQNIEVIAVENGSTDRTLELLKNIKDTRLVIMQSEKGVSNARNMGLRKAHGKYVIFLDADDWLATDAIEIMMVVKEEDVDIVSARYYDDKPFEVYEYKRFESGSEEYIVKCLCTPTKRGNCTGNLYRLGFIKEHDITFDPRLSHAEDTVFLTELLIKRPIVIDLEKPVYHVYSNPRSATREGKEDNAESFCNAISRIYSLLEGTSDNIKNAGYICALNQLLVILVNSDKNIFEMVRYIIALFQRDVFHEAIERADVSQLNGIIKLVFKLMKEEQYFLLAVIVKGRSLLNFYRRRK